MASHPISFNPYAPPRAALGISEVAAGGILAFPRFSAWFVLLLNVLTLGLYPLYWLYSRTKIANRVLPRRPIATSVVLTTFVTFAVGFVGGLLVLANPQDATLHLTSRMLNLAAWATQLIWEFQFRDRLSEIANQPKVGRVLTFFFGPLYLQYKINERIDRLHAGEIALDDAAASSEASA